MMMKNNLEEKKDMLLEEITEKLECLINGFEKVLYDDDDIFLHQQAGVFLREGNKQLEFAATPITPRPYQGRNLFDDPLKCHIAAINV